MYFEDIKIDKKVWIVLVCAILAVFLVFGVFVGYKKISTDKQNAADAALPQIKPIFIVPDEQGNDKVYDATTALFFSLKELIIQHEDNVTVYYTNDASDPADPESATRLIYSEPIKIYNGYTMIKAVGIGANGDISKPFSAEFTVDANYAIKFKDSALEEIFKRYLKIPETETLKVKDLDYITRFIYKEVNGKNIIEINYGDTNSYDDIPPVTDFSDLFELRYLTFLEICGKDFSDLSPIRRQMRLTTLILESNNITNIAPIGRLKEITSLSLKNNNLTDVSPLQTLTKLTELNISNNNLNDISALEKVQLITLRADNNKISDLSFMSEYTRISELSLCSNEMADLSPLSELKSMRILKLDDNMIKDILPLKKLVRISDLWLRNNQIFSLLPIGKADANDKGGIDKTSRLFLEGNPIESYEPIEYVWYYYK